jgi:hypothetical protein
MQKQPARKTESAVGGAVKSIRRASIKAKKALTTFVAAAVAAPLPLENEDKSDSPQNQWRSGTDANGDLYYFNKETGEKVKTGETIAAPAAEAEGK